jgi:hypothetical protein
VDICEEDVIETNEDASRQDRACIVVNNPIPGGREREIAHKQEDADKDKAAKRLVEDYIGR